MASSIGISRDDIVLIGHARRWQEAMETMGRVSVEAQLLRRPGRPNDPMPDIGDKSPYPTREFCQQWCTEQDNIIFRFTPRTPIIAILFLIMIGCLAHGISSVVRPKATLPGNAPMPAQAATMPMMTTTAPNTSQNGPTFRAYQPVVVPQSMPLPTMQQNQSMQQSQQAMPQNPSMLQNAPASGASSQ
jgi:hypothetical protein